MKITVSVPDELWAEAADPGDSPSAVVQEGLRLRADRRAAQSAPFEGDSEMLERAMAGEFSGKLDDLVRQAEGLRSGGYTVGVDAALSLPWDVLDRATDPVQLRAELIAWFKGYDDGSILPDAFYQTLHQLILDYDLRGITDEGDEIRLNSVLVEALVAGITDTRSAVVILQRSKDLPDPTKSDHRPGKDD